VERAYNGSESDNAPEYDQESGDDHESQKGIQQAMAKSRQDQSTQQKENVSGDSFASVHQGKQLENASRNQKKKEEASSIGRDSLRRRNGRPSARMKLKK